MLERLGSDDPSASLSGPSLPPCCRAELSVPHLRMHSLLPVWSVPGADHGSVPHMVPGPLLKIFSSGHCDTHCGSGVVISMPNLEGSQQLWQPCCPHGAGTFKLPQARKRWRQRRGGTGHASPRGRHSGAQQASMLGLYGERGFIYSIRRSGGVYLWCSNFNRNPHSFLCIIMFE